MKGYIMQLQPFSVNDGDGIRTTIFMAGCPLRCKWCSNPEGFTAQEKSRGFAGSPFGITGLETAFALSYTELVKKDGMRLTDLIKAMSLNPAEVLKIDKGCVAKGKAADICLAGLDEAYRIDIEESASKGKNSPFDGREVYGKIVMTIVDGKVVYTT